MTTKVFFDQSINEFNFHDSFLFYQSINEFDVSLSQNLLKYIQGYTRCKVVFKQSYYAHLDYKILKEHLYRVPHLYHPEERYYKLSFDTKSTYEN